MADTKCVWFDEESEVCLNGDCPVCADFCPLSEYRGVCKYEELENRKITNADRIRAMSDDELTVFIDDLTCHCIDCLEECARRKCPIYKEGIYCSPEDIMNWLQQPAEEEKI